MTKRTKLALFLLLCLLSLPFIWLLVAKKEWLPVPTNEQVLARQRLEKTVAPSTGRNAIVLGELLRFSVPKSEWRGWIEHGPVGIAEALRREGYEPLSISGGCSESGERCLAEAENDPESMRRLTELTMRQRSQLGKFHSSAYAYLDASDSHYSFEQELPNLAVAASIAQIEVARRFLNGHADDAIQLACADAAFWRRISFRTNSLINRLIGLKSLIRSGQMLNAMLVRLGQGPSVGSDCIAAFEPLTPQERDICDLMSTEYWTLRGMFNSKKPKERWYLPRWDSEYVRGRIASNLLKDCASDGVSGSSADAAIDDDSGRACSVIETVFDPLGCLAVDPSNHYGKYRRRIVDHSVTLSALHSALVVNNRSAGELLRTAFQNRPSGDLRERQRLLTADNDEIVLTLEPDSFEAGYRFEPIRLRGDPSVDQSAN